MLPRLATYNTYMRSFQYKLINNVLVLNKKLHNFGVKSSPLRSFCNLCEETPLHIFYECDRIKCLWSDLVQYFQNCIVLPTLTPQTAIFGFLIPQIVTTISCVFVVSFFYVCCRRFVFCCYVCCVFCCYFCFMFVVVVFVFCCCVCCVCCCFCFMF